MSLSARRKRKIEARIALVVLLTLAPAAWGQKGLEVQAPLSLTGILGVGYSSRQIGDVSASSPVVTGTADLSGYWRDPRILVFNVDPFVSFGNSVSSESDIANHGKGFNADTTLLGGSFLPVGISYSRFSQQFPNSSNSGNVLGARETSSSYSGFAVDPALLLFRLPPLYLHYGTSDSASEAPQLVGGSSGTQTTTYSASSSYNLAKWQIDGQYSRSHSKGSRVNLLSLGSPTQSENIQDNELRVNAQRPLPLKSNLSLSGGQKTWNDNIIDGLQLGNSYDYARTTLNSHPLNRITTNLQADYISNQRAVELQQVLGIQGGVPVNGLNPSTVFSARNMNFGGGAQVRLPIGFSVQTAAKLQKFHGAQGLEANGLQGDVGLNYQRNLRRAGSLMASYTYQQGRLDTEYSAQPTPSQTSTSQTTTAQSLRVGFSSMLAHQLQLGGTAHLDQRLLVSSISSPGRSYGLSFTAARPLKYGWKFAGEFGFNKNITEFPVYTESKNIDFGIRAESRALEFSLQRTYQEGLALQVGNGLVFVTNPQDAILSPLNSVLSTNGVVQTTLRGIFEPGRKRLRILASWTSFSADANRVHITDASTINASVSYRLRRLRLQMGYISSDSQVVALGPSSAYRRREIYFEVLRNFRLF